MKSKLYPLSMLSATVAAVLLLTAFQTQKPVLYLIGDSTVKNGSGTGGGEQWGWGSFVSEYFDTSKVRIENRALGGTSSRTFITRGLWDSVLKRLKPGDYVVMQFGHNDGSPLDDTARARGTIKGTGDESREIFNPITKQKEVVHTYGWYLTRIIHQAKERGAIPVVCSPVPRNNFQNGKVSRGGGGYSKLAQETAVSAGAIFIDLNAMVCDEYDRLGEEKVKTFFPADHTHTNMEGAKINAGAVVTGLQQHAASGLNKYLSSTK